jgi:hypothetical protein
MAVFLVRISATGFRATFAGKETLCGFIKNEYVLASGPKRAVEKAIARVRKRVLEGETIHRDDRHRIELKVEAVEPGYRLGSLFSREGMIFHPVDADVRVSQPT